MSRAPAVFAESFAHWSIELPAAVVARRLDGVLHADGWQIRVRWHDDGSLEYRAGHRMTSERWAVIAPDGSVEQVPVPSEGMIVPRDATDEEAQAIRDEYGRQWRRHHEHVGERDMEWSADGPVWTRVDGAWRSSQSEPGESGGRLSALARMIGAQLKRG